jgi:hypothetical protein
MTKAIVILQFTQRALWIYIVEAAIFFAIVAAIRAHP